MFAVTSGQVAYSRQLDHQPSLFSIFKLSLKRPDTMFGALNRFIGRLDGEPVQQNRSGPSDSAFGFQVLRNKDTELPLEPWFDFIVGINGHPIVSLPTQKLNGLAFSNSSFRKTPTPISSRRKSVTARGQT